MHPSMLKELTSIIWRPLSIIFERLWQLGEVPDGWDRPNITSIFRKDKKEDPENYRLVSLTLFSQEDYGENPLRIHF